MDDMPSGTLQIVESYFAFCCPECGTQMAVTNGFIKDRRQDGKRFYCPWGHHLSYSGDTDLDKAKAEAEQARAAAESLRRQLKSVGANLQAERRSHASTKGKLTKTKNRIAKGVCPCCNRSFVNLERHMSGQHPEYVQ